MINWPSVCARACRMHVSLARRLGEVEIMPLRSVIPVERAAATAARPAHPNQTTVVEHRSLYSSAFHQLITFNHFHEVGCL